MRLVDGNDNRPSWGEARGQCAPEVNVAPCSGHVRCGSHRKGLTLRCTQVTPWHKKLLHKATFTFSVVCTLTIAIFTGGHPWLMPYLCGRPPANARAHVGVLCATSLGFARSLATSPSFRQPTCPARHRAQDGAKATRGRCAGYSGVHSYTGMFPFFVGFRIKDYLFTENQ